MYSVQMQAHGQLGCVLTVDEVAEGVEIKGTEAVLAQRPPNGRPLTLQATCQEEQPPAQRE